MPLLVKDYTWHETDAEVVLKLPLKGVKPSKVDVTATDRFIKVCCAALCSRLSRRACCSAGRVVRGTRASAVWARMELTRGCGPTEEGLAVVQWASSTP